jgi:flagellar biosynthesis/type III secretory pathway chaperone
MKKICLVVFDPKFYKKQTKKQNKKFTDPDKLLKQIKANEKSMKCDPHKAFIFKNYNPQTETVNQRLRKYKKFEKSCRLKKNKSSQNNKQILNEIKTQFRKIFEYVQN